MTGADWNALRFDPGKGRDHVESYFIKANDPTGERAVWLKATVFARGREPEGAVAEGWAIAFDRRGGAPRQIAVKHTLPFDRASFGPRGLDASWELGADRLRMRAEAAAPRGDSAGVIARGDRRVAWDIAFEGEPRAMTLVPLRALYDDRAPTSKSVTPYPDLRMKGTVEAFGETWTLDGWRGAQGHNWGRRHPEAYGWAQVNIWDDDTDLVLEGTGVRVRVGPVVTPFITLASVRYRGVAYDFTDPASLVRATSDVTLRSWTFVARNRHARVEALFEAADRDLVGLEYANPSGPMTYCLNSKLARARVRFEPEGRPPLVLTSRAAALEILTQRIDHGVTIQA